MLYRTDPSVRLQNSIVRGIYVKKGFSTIVSTVILTSVMLMIVLSASSVVIQVFNAEAENAEFNQAKNVMQALANEINQITFKSNLSGYIKAGFRTSLPQLIETNETLEVWIDGALVEEVPIKIIKIQGGRMVSATNTNLVGSEDILLTDPSSSLCRVYVNRSETADVILDLSRGRFSFLGTFEFYNGTDFETYNLVEGFILEVTFGSINAHKESVIYVKNAGFEINQIEASGDFTIETRVSETVESTSLSELGGNPNYSTIINLQTVSVEISIYGGS